MLKQLIGPLPNVIVYFILARVSPSCQSNSSRSLPIHRDVLFFLVGCDGLKH